MATRIRTPGNSDKKIMSLKREIIRSVKSALKTKVRGSQLRKYKTVWDPLQTVSVQAMKDVLMEGFPEAEFRIQTKKSGYPDLEMNLGELRFAFDVKSHESHSGPNYDIARMGTVASERLEKYDEEYDVVIRYDREAKVLIEVYFERMRETVGYHKSSKGCKYRCYDGKLRPKIWNDFESGRIYWKDKKAFIEGVQRSQVYRFKSMIKDELVGQINESQKREFRSLFS